MAFKKGFYKGWLTDKGLLQLRREITLGSLFIADYNNSFGISPNLVCDFFNGYISYLEEIADEQGGETFSHDNDQNLLSWYGCFEENPFC